MNDLSTFASLVGGGTASGQGGILTIAPLTKPVPTLLTPPEQPNVGSQLLLDVIDWEILLDFDEMAIACGGGLGATTSRRVGYNYAWAANVVIDWTKLAEPWLRCLPSCSILFKAAQADQIEVLANPGQVQDKYWWAPYAKFRQSNPMLNAGGKKRTRQKLTGTVSGHILLLTQVEDISNGNTMAGAYARYLQNSGNV